LCLSAGFLFLAKNVLSGGVLAEVSYSQVEAQNSPHATFVGSERCSACHPGEHRDWLSSQHKAAMQEATEATVLGNFDSATFAKDGVESTFFKKDGKFWVRTDGPDGKIADFEIRHTFGVAPLQQYLIELPGGRLQALGIAWDARAKDQGGQRWFHLYPDRVLKAGDPLHWTGIDQNWNFQCAYCHSTNLQKNYDASAGTFRTTWSEMSVGCESCHGPAAKHLTWATKSSGWRSIDTHSKGFAISLDERKGAAWSMADNGQAARSKPRTTSKEIEVCAACHARRQQFSADPDHIGRLFDSFRPSLIESGLYHSDGQQLDEVYIYGSFLQSRMYAAGVTCSDCHNPHSGRLRHERNSVCTTCHAADRFDAISHHHHATGAQAAKCTACHMPPTTYMGVDARHDHSMRIPRPDRSIRLGTPNACTQCHADKTATWAKEAIASWYPSPKSGAQEFAEALDLGDRQAPRSQAELSRVALDDNVSVIARASALQRLSHFVGSEILDVAAQALRIGDPLIRTAAISIIAQADANMRQRLLAPLLRDTARTVRMDAARALAENAEAGLTSDDRRAHELALAEYVDAQNFNAERPEAQANLGGLYLDRRQFNEAEAAFRKAIVIDPKFVAASISLADLLRRQGDESAAATVLQQSLAANPGSGPLLHALGLSLIRQKRSEEAMPLLVEAAQASPEEPRFSYVLAVALHDSGQIAKAMVVLKNTLLRHPYNRELLWAKVSYDIELNNISSAIGTVELLNLLEPRNQQVRNVLERLRRGN